jgi:hypothetical protein
MKISKTISTLIVGLAIMGFTSVGMAYNGGGMGYEGYDSGMGYGGYDYEKEETTSEVPGEEEETVAEAEPEAPPMEEEEYTEEERVVPVAGEGEEEITIPEIY